MSEWKSDDWTYLKEERAGTLEVPEEVRETVREVLGDVAEGGDDALAEYTARFDDVERDSPRLSEAEIEEAVGRVSEDDREAIDEVVANVREFHEAQRERVEGFEIEPSEGVTLGQRVVPVERVGTYVPGGRHPLVASVAMSVVPAAVAGVESIATCAPPHEEHGGIPHPVQVYAMREAGADEIYAAGGAQAIAALAHGTETVRAVDKIAGPGNVFVVEAKRQLYGRVGIDFLAGPTEILVLADGSADPELVAADLLAQAEHDVDARPILVTTDRDLAGAVEDELAEQLTDLRTEETAREAWERNGEVVLAADLGEACEIANAYAIEHLHVLTGSPRALADDLHNYGSLFLGENAPVVFSDKAIGTNHILPTRRVARYTGGVWVGTYLKTLTYQELTDEGAAEVADLAERICRLEGMHAHELSARRRRE
jgi:histidinol dehydrogenase/sulfopropanediol 3-dehydrogenase